MMIKTQPKPIGLLCYTDAAASRTTSVEVDLDDSLRHGDSERFEPALAMTAAALSLSSATENLLSANLKALGYENLYASSFENRAKDRIGMVLGVREGEREREVAVVLRGTAGTEWYSNFDLGYSAEHRGFSRAADYAERVVGDRIFSLGSRKENRFFVTGYSRGGAVANILSKRLCDRYGIDAVRAYTFAAPNTAMTFKGARYGSICNIVRDEDFFARVPLTGWGYTKYGRTITLSGDVSRRYRALNREDYIGFTNAEQVSDILGAVMALAPNVRAYYGRYYPVGSRVMSLYDLMMEVAAMLAGEAHEHFGEVMAAAAISRFAELTSFLGTGTKIADLILPSAGIPRCSVADSHSPAAYMAALEAYLESGGY
jgi:hypothetical protein